MFLTESLIGQVHRVLTKHRRLRRSAIMRELRRAQNTDYLSIPIECRGKTMSRALDALRHRKLIHRVTGRDSGWELADEYERQLAAGAAL